jgi:CRISPR-associated protein Cas5d
MGTGSMFQVRVGAEHACFSRPEFKVERVTYPVITPSAARGLLEAIFWKPEIRWEIRDVRLLRPLRFTTLLRNDLSERQDARSIVIEEQRQQRAALILRDVEYVITAELIRRPHAESPLVKYTDQARRRLERGQCHHQPCLGNREFSAWFEPATGGEPPISLDLAIGPMLFDLAFREDQTRTELAFRHHGANGRREARGFAEAMFFDATIAGGVMQVPPEKYTELYARMQADAPRT